MGSAGRISLTFPATPYKAHAGAPQQGACALSLNVKNESEPREFSWSRIIGCSGMDPPAAMAAEILPC